MGAAIVLAARDRGAQVTIVAADIDVPLPQEATVVRVETAAELHAALLAIESVDVLVMAAAVADFRPMVVAKSKLDRQPGMTLELEPTEDILADMARQASGSDTRRPVLVGFAAETGGLDRVADKLERKGIDLLVANDVAEPGSGFGTETNRVTMLTRGGQREELPLLPKRVVADQLLDRVVRLLDDRDADAQTFGQDGSLHRSPLPE
jgi:phosphopantothenoylcysteine decarboxylase/phosphopantothenate--cysteine ligase